MTFSVLQRLGGVDSAQAWSVRKEEPMGLLDSLFRRKCQTSELPSKEVDRADERNDFPRIPVDVFNPKPGRMRAHIFQNPHIGLAPTLFYDITIPLDPFDSGLEWEEQPVHTEFTLEFIRFPVKDWRNFDGRSFEVPEDQADGSIYLGDAHNPVNIRQIKFTRVGDVSLQIQCSLFCDFEYEGIAESAVVGLATEVEFEGAMIERSIIEGDPTESGRIRAAIAQLVSLDAYRIEPQVSEHYVSLPPNAGEGAT